MNNTNSSAIPAGSCLDTGYNCGSATNYPQFIDTAACLCGLIASREVSKNGNQVQLWRCIGNTNENVNSGGHGKWYQTQLPSEELSGLGQPQNWPDNPPNTKTTYTLEDVDGQPKYVTYNGTGDVNLLAVDKMCNGMNSTSYSARYYGNHQGKTGPAPSSASSSSSAASTSSASSGTSTASSAPAPTQSRKSAASSVSGPTTMKLLMFAAVLLAPLATISI